MSNTNNQTDRRNDANVANQIITAIMRNEQSNTSRQAQLVLYMFDSEVTYSAAEVAKFFTGEAKERPERIQNALVRISDEYSNVLEFANELREQKKADKARFSDADGIKLEQALGKLGAANRMFKDAAKSVYYLRKVKAFGVKVLNNGALFFYAHELDDKGKPVTDPHDNNAPVKIRTTLSGNALMRLGQKALDADFKPATATANASTTTTTKVGISQSALTVTTKLATLRKSGKIALDELADEEEKSVLALFRELMVAKFAGNDGAIDFDALREYVREEFPETETLNSKAKNGNGNGNGQTAETKA